MAETYGQPLTLSFSTFSDAAGTVPADPTTVTLAILNPDGTERDYTWTAASPGTDIQHPSTGVFTFNAPTITTAGPHYCRAKGIAGLVAAAELGIGVRRSKFTSP